jgi:hypothetical protein
LLTGAIEFVAEQFADDGSVGVLTNGAQG